MPISLQETIRLHKESVHMKVLYSCKKCTYQATQRTHLRTHEKSIHEGIKHQCKVCKAEFTQKTHLKTHVEGVHIQEKKFACDSCTFKTHATKNLKSHINAIHQNIKYPCNYCDHQAPQKSALTVHIKRNHRESKSLTLSILVGIFFKFHTLTRPQAALLQQRAK